MKDRTTLIKASQTAIGGSAKSRWKITSFIFIGILLFLLTIGIVSSLIFYKLHQIKESEPAKLAIRHLKNSPIVQDKLGEMKSIWPRNSIWTGGLFGTISVENDGKGYASLLFSVEGSKAGGKYYVTLNREHGAWRIESSQLVMGNGAFFVLEDDGNFEKTSRPAKEVFVSSKVGRQLRVGPIPQSGWREIQWPGHPISFQVPADWEQRELDGYQAEFRASNPSAYLLAFASLKAISRNTIELLLRDLRRAAEEDLKNGKTLGYAIKGSGEALGLLEIQGYEGRATTIKWTLYFETAKLGTEAVTFSVGAPFPEVFDKIEPQLGAILDSVRFH